MCVSELPAPSALHATCAWCVTRFESIIELLDHVTEFHNHVDLPASKYEAGPAS